MDWKERMDKQRKAIQSNIQNLKKQYTKAKDDRVLREKLEGAINRLGIEADRYDARKVEPVRLPNGLVVNAKLVKAYLTKIKGNPIEFKLAELDFQISFETKYSKGRLILSDMHEYFIGWDLPVKEVDEDGQISFT